MGLRSCDIPNPNYVYVNLCNNFSCVLDILMFFNVVCLLFP